MFGALVTSPGVVTAQPGQTSDQADLDALDPSTAEGVPSVAEMAPIRRAMDPAVRSVLESMGTEAGRELDAGSANRRAEVQLVQGTRDTPMQVLTSPTWGVPSFIGGPGFGIGRFDLTRSPEEIVDGLLTEWNFLGIIDPATELELVRDRGGSATRALTFQQRIAGVLVHESRLTFTFDAEGRFIYFGGHYIPEAELLAPPHANDCEMIVGTTDDLGGVITGCSARYSQVTRFTGRREGELVPVFLLTVETGDGFAGSQILSESTGRFHREVNYYTYATRQVYHQETGDTNYSLYYQNETCTSPYCNDPDVIRIKNDLSSYASHMHGAYGRHSWEGHTDCTYPIQCPYYTTYVDDQTLNPGWDPYYERVQLDYESRKSTLVHEWSHAVINTEAPGVDSTINEGLADTYGVLFQGETAHWCYHNYQSATALPYWNEYECPRDHVQHGRCSMLAGDTVHDVPTWSWVKPSTSQNGIQPLVPGIAYNVIDGGTGHDEHLPGSIYAKVFELFQIDQWEDPNVGPETASAECSDHVVDVFPAKTPVTYFNGFQLSGSVSFSKAQQLWYRFVTEKLDSAKTRPWSNFGPAFEQAAAELYAEGALTFAEYVKAVNASRAVGHRQAPSTIPNHGGSTLRQAALIKNGQWLLFYSRSSDNRIVYQRRVSGVWQSSVLFTSGAAKTYKGIDAYDLPDGSARVIFKRYDTNDVLYLKVNADASVPDQVYMFACAPTATNAPAGIHDGTRELIVSSSASGISLMKMDSCDVVNTNYLNPLKGGVSLTKHRGEIYLIGTGTSTSTYYNRQIVFWLKQSNYLFYNTSNPYAGTLTCADYDLTNDCFSWSQSGGQTPNIYSVAMPSGRETFQRMYVGFTNSTSSFKLTRFDVRLDGGAHYLTKKTRFLPVDSDGTGNYNELEFLQQLDYLFVFENNRLHWIKLY